MGITTITAVLGAVLLCTVSLGAASAELTCSDDDFQAWVNEHRPSEFEKEEYEKRKALYCKTVERVAAHNEKFKNGESSFFMKVNQFAAHTVEERRMMFGTMPSKDNEGPVQKKAPQKVSEKTQIEGNVTAVDWRKSGKVSSIKNQGQCGSCWAFSAIGSMEGAVSIAEGFTWNTSDESQGFSVDQCLWCTPGTYGCQGGYPHLCFEHIIENGGIDSEEDWPYLSSDCNPAKEKFEKVASIVSFTNVSDGDEVGLRKALVQQPVSVSITANCDAFMSYGGGVLDTDCGGGEHAIDHSVLAIGYDTGAQTPYYIVKNSWGRGWGEDGYVRMKIGVNLDCIACKAVYPKAGPKPPKPQPELQCKAGTYDPNEDPTSCPSGSTCCCAEHKFWKPKECKATACCLENETCKDGHGCQQTQHL